MLKIGRRLIADKDRPDIMRFFAIDDELDDASKDAHEEQETMEAQEAQNHQLFQSALSLQVAGNEADAVAAYLQLLTQPLIEQADAEAAEIKSRPSLHLRFLALKNLSELEEAAGKLVRPPASPRRSAHRAARRGAVAAAWSTREPHGPAPPRAPRARARRRQQPAPPAGGDAAAIATRGDWRHEGDNAAPTHIAAPAAASGAPPKGCAARTTAAQGGGRR